MNTKADKMSTATLATAANLISWLKKTDVTGIQFEDGSGQKFNYQLDGNQKWFFIDLEQEDLRGYYAEAIGKEPQEGERGL